MPNFSSVHTSRQKLPDFKERAGFLRTFQKNPHPLSLTVFSYSSALFLRSESFIVLNNDLAGDDLLFQLCNLVYDLLRELVA